MNSKYFTLKNLHLIISVMVLIPASLIYGLHPDGFWTDFIGLNVSNIDLINIFKAIMGLYLGFASLWLLGIVKPAFWFTATLSNIAFMGGLGLGRTVSLFADGIPSGFYLTGGFLELLLAFLGIFIYNLEIRKKKEDKR
ncbi:MAG: DUF4345 domain-containing protein [Flavobacteriaceae bacterium]|nr:DUF4345 domain-containing protein [Flavobacteriaceae bacterium]